MKWVPVFKSHGISISFNVTCKNELTELRALRGMHSLSSGGLPGVYAQR